MARTLYGPVAVATPTPDPSDGTALAYASAPLNVYETALGGTPQTDLRAVTAALAIGSPISAVTPDPGTGAASWWGRDGFTGTMYVEDPSTGVRWPVFPTDLADRASLGGVPPHTHQDTDIGGVPAHTHTVADLDAATQTRIADAILDTIIDLKGDLLVGTAADTLGRLPAPTGAGVALLVPDPTGSLGLRWVTSSTFQALLGANVWWMPIWDGVGTHPTRPVGLPATSFVKWRQPTAPLVGATYSKPGDEWLATA